MYTQKKTALFNISAVVYLDFFINFIHVQTINRRIHPHTAMAFHQHQQEHTFRPD
jgi:hypothetical protein